jgi:hypothetical protein
MKNHLLILPFLVFTTTFCEFHPQMKLPKGNAAENGQADHADDKRTIFGKYVIPGANYVGAVNAGTKILLSLYLSAAGSSKLSEGDLDAGYQAGWLFLYGMTAVAEGVNHVVSARANNSPVMNKKLIASNLIFAAFNTALAVCLPCPITWVFAGVNGTVQLATAAYKYNTAQPASSNKGEQG